MKFLVVTDAPTLEKEGLQMAYTPYVNEMDIWFKYVDEVTIISPTTYHKKLLLSSFEKRVQVGSVVALNFNSFFNIIISLINLPIVAFKLMWAMFKADHIHLRCPGNVGLLGCLVQIFFPKKPKTAKYAGNWDPNAKQPLSYKFQKWILSNTFLTKNMQVLVYGDWEHQTKNIKPFFTATYKKAEIEGSVERDYSKALKFVFVGTLSPGKRPLLAIQIVEGLYKQGKNVTLNLYGEGVLKETLETYIKENGLESIVTLHGNQPKEVIKTALKTAHFSILPSKSEGWPKAVAEAMFFGVIPISTSISCVPYMLDYGKRGILISENLDEAIAMVGFYLKDISRLSIMSTRAQAWSQIYTLDKFEFEISKWLKP